MPPVYISRKPGKGLKQKSKKGEKYLDKTQITAFL